MPVPDAATFARIIDAAQHGDYALASINVTSTETANAAMAAFAESASDGILQLSTGGAEFVSGPAKDMALGAISLAEHVHRVAERLPVYVALTTDHCVPGKVAQFVRPLIAETRRRRAAGLPNLFNGHMFDGSELPMDENMAIACDLLRECAEQELILEVEIGIVGGEEDGIDNTGAHSSRLYTSPEDMLHSYEALYPLGRFTLAAAFGNVHGVYKQGNVALKPEVLREGNALVAQRHGANARMDLVFHGGSGSDLNDIHAAIKYGVVKMNVDTDCQYAFSRAVAGHMFENYEGVLRIDGEMGDKKAYDPRSYLKKGQDSMRARVVRACTELLSLGKTLCGNS
ncbi:MAG: class II fructose-bisphosphate aldolase [Fimbriimonadaceae bacterium]